MSTYVATISWERGNQKFTDGRYSRVHHWRFDGGAEVHASASPHVVPPPMSSESAVDPEEAFVASLSSCHMLWFLAIAAKRGFCIDRYADHAEGILEKSTEGKMAITRVILRPDVVFSGERMPSSEEIEEIHHRSHAECYIANSVKTDVRCEPVPAAAGR